MVDVRKSWDRIAEPYRKRYEISTDIVHFGPLCPGEDKLHLLGDIKGKSIIDLGCGGGQNAIALSKMGAEVTAVDFSKEQIKLAENLAADHNVAIDFITSQISDLSFLPKSGYDLALSACAIAFMEDIKAAFAEASRILKPGGRFILSDMNPLQYIIDEIEGGVEFNHIYPYEPILLKWHWEFDELKRAPGFQHYVRSLPHYHNALTAAGFIVSKILEPQSTVETPHIGFSREIMKEYRYTAEHIPITFIMVCHKP